MFILKSCEKFVSPKSDYYLYSPSMAAQNMFLYPLYVGHFIYESGYRLRRDTYDSFLLMYVQKGALTLEYEGKTRQASTGDFVLLDCYRPHAYRSDTGWESLWCHFDGPTARAQYEAIEGRLGNVFSVMDSNTVLNRLNAVYETFRKGEGIREPLMAKYLTDILTSFHLASPAGTKSCGCTSMAEEVIAYISEHFSEEIPVSELARRASLSQYHFIRTFKKETGFTPHEYLINTRMNTARYLLKNSALPIKDICFQTGFSSESVFCSAFKKYQGCTPAQYRSSHETSLN